MLLDVRSLLGLPLNFTLEACSWPKKHPLLKSTIKSNHLVSLGRSPTALVSGNGKSKIIDNSLQSIKFVCSSVSLNSNSVSTNLKKGYSILTQKNKILSSVKKININLDLEAKLSDGKLKVNVKKINWIFYVAKTIVLDLKLSNFESIYEYFPSF